MHWSFSGRQCFYKQGINTELLIGMISVICGTNRKGSNSLKFCNSISTILNQLDQDSRKLDLRDLPNDFVFNNEVYGASNGTLDQLQNDHVADADRFIFVIPEYNGSFPGVVKAFLDSFSPSKIHYKKALIIGISSGRSGNVRGLEHFTGVLNYLRVTVYPFKPAIANCHHLIDEDQNVVRDEKTLELLQSTIEEFLKF